MPELEPAEALYWPTEATVIPAVAALEPEDADLDEMPVSETPFIVFTSEIDLPAERELTPV